MSVKGETNLQHRIQKYIESKGGYVNKNHGDMTTRPGIADLTVCYRGIYLALEVKEGSNKPSKAQGVHARSVWKAGGFCYVVWSLDEVKLILNQLDKIKLIVDPVDTLNIDDGTKW